MTVGQRRQTGTAEREGMIFRDQALGLVTCDDRCIQMFRQAGQRRRVRLVHDVESGNDQGTFGIVQQATALSNAGPAAGPAG